MLTPEQIQGFEDRAAAGERPALEWRGEMPSHVPGLNAVLCVYPAYLERSQPWWRYRGHAFSVLPAAQLAAEHLLREATRPLHDDAMAGVWQRSHEELAKAYGELEAKAGALLARVAELEAETAWRPMSMAPLDGSEFDVAFVPEEGKPARVAACYWSEHHNFWRIVGYGTPFERILLGWRPRPVPPTP